MPNYDAIIIGTGQAGPSLAGRLAQAGMKVAIVERKLFGGTCVNTGCIPTKTMVASAYAAHLARRAAEFGVAIAGALSVDMRASRRARTPSSRHSTTGVETWLEDDAELHGLRRPRAASSRRARSRSAARLLTRASRSSSTSAAGRSCPPMPGLDQVPYLTNSSMMDVDFLPRASGHRRRQLYRAGVRPDVPPLRQRGHDRRDGAAADRRARTRMSRRPSQEILESEGIERPPEREVHRAFAARRRRSRAASIAPSGPPEVVGSHLLLAVGRRPNTDDLGLEKAGVAVDRARLHRGGRRAAHQRAGHLGAGRLQRQGRLHPHLLQRFRDRRGATCSTASRAA